jgi:hypothetical protein
MVESSSTAIVGRLVGVARRGGALAARLAAWSLGASAVIVGVAASASPFSGSISVALAAVLGLLLALPGIVLVLYGWGLRRLSQLPSGLIESAQSLLAEALPPAPARGATRTLWGLSRYLFRIRGTLLDRGAWLAETTLLVRLGHPLVLAAVLASIGASLLLIPFAGLALLILLIV